MPWARRTNRLREGVRLIGHGMGGRPGERLLSRLGMPVSDDTILRAIKRVDVDTGAVPLRAVVRASSAVLVMAAELGVQGFLLLVARIVPVLFAPFPDCLQPSTETLDNGLHVHCELPLPAADA
jgi:hypothetical protein